MIVIPLEDILAFVILSEAKDRVFILIRIKKPMKASDAFFEKNAF